MHGFITLLDATSYDKLVSQFLNIKHSGNSYRKNPKISDTRKFAVITLKV